MADSKKLKVQVIAGKNLVNKNGANKNDPYCEVAVLDNQGNKIGKAQTTKILKSTLDPDWSQLLEFNVPSSAFSGLKVICWDKHKFRADKFLGQVTIKFNTALLASSEKLDDWFPLNKRKTGEVVTGDIHLQIQYGDVKESSATPIKDRSHTITNADVTNLKISSNFNTEETNKKLQNSTHVIVAEEEEQDAAEKDDDEYEKVRDGPSTAALDKLSKDDKDIALANKNLEVTNNSTSSYNVEFAIGNVRINSGKWYYEVRIVTSGQIQIGWSTTKFNNKTNTGDSWTYDGSRQLKLRNGQGNDRYGEYWSTGDIIGCAVDVEAKTIQFWRNGKDLGVAYNDVTTGGVRLAPLVGVARRTKVQVNFGKDSFAFPQEGYNMLHCFLTEKEIDQLLKLFIKYRDIGNEGLIEEKKQENNNNKDQPVEVDLKESIHGAGLMEFAKDLGVESDDDPTLLVIAWKLKAEKVWELSKEEFMNGFMINACNSIDKIKAKAKEWKDDLKTNAQHFKQFYNFVFDYLKEDKKVLLTEEAVIAWNLVLSSRKWPMFDDFVKFLQEEGKKAISRDAWQQLWHFMQAYPNDLKQYDSMSSWPIIFDEFYEWVEGKGKK
mmetsp:Transcript_17632/g.24490  ORF Transcript_17632/g.24490 Transcript_17632/m.24490 type:complete len:605 (+) Transcript_17632:224-2038(+)